MVGYHRILKKPKNLNIMVIRLNANGDLNNARPCYQCTLMLKNLGINKVYYSVDNNIVCEKIANMISINSSNSRKKVDRLQYRAPTDIIEYYRYIITKMPKEIKKYNADHFVKNIFIELEGCHYKMTKKTLTIFVYEHVLGIINII